MDLKLSYSDMEMIASQLATSSQNMQTLLENIKTQFNLIGDDSVWSGTAASETKAVFDELSAKFPAFYEAVQSCHLFLTSTVLPSYKEIDAAITGKASNQG